MKWIASAEWATAVGAIGAGVGVAWGWPFGLIVAGGLVWLEVMLADVLQLIRAGGGKPQ